MAEMIKRINSGQDVLFASDVGVLPEAKRATISWNCKGGSEVLDNMRLDIRVRTSPSMAIQASLAQNLQSDADLQIRGTGWANPRWSVRRWPIRSPAVYSASSA
jgi:hypothetical protein